MRFQWCVLQSHSHCRTTSMCKSKNMQVFTKYSCTKASFLKFLCFLQNAQNTIIHSQWNAEWCPKGQQFCVETHIWDQNTARESFWRKMWTSLTFLRWEKHRTYHEPVIPINRKEISIFFLLHIHRIHKLVL